MSDYSLQGFGQDPKSQNPKKDDDKNEETNNVFDLDLSNPITTESDSIDIDVDLVGEEKENVSEQSDGSVFDLGEYSVDSPQTFEDKMNAEKIQEETIAAQSQEFLSIEAVEKLDTEQVDDIANDILNGSGIQEKNIVDNAEKEEISQSLALDESKLIQENNPIELESPVVMENIESKSNEDDILDSLDAQENLELEISQEAIQDESSETSEEIKDAENLEIENKTVSMEDMIQVQEIEVPNMSEKIESPIPKKSLFGFLKRSKKEKIDAEKKNDDFTQDIGENDFVLGVQKLDKVVTKTPLEEVKISMPVEDAPQEVNPYNISGLNVSTLNVGNVDNTDNADNADSVDNTDNTKIPNEGKEEKFTINTGIQSPVQQEESIQSASSKFSTIKLDIFDAPKTTQEADKNIFSKAGTLFPQNAKEDSENPVINILSEIAKNGVSVEGDITQGAETELFKQVQKKKKVKESMKKVMFSIVGLVLLLGVGGGAYMGMQNKAFLASILKVTDISKPSEATTPNNNPPIGNSGNNPVNNGASDSDKDREIANLKQQLVQKDQQMKLVMPDDGKPKNDKELQDLKAQLAQKQSELESLKANGDTEKLKEQTKSLAKQLLEKNKTISALMATKDSSGFSGVTSLTKDEMNTVLLKDYYSFYIQDYNYIKASSVSEQTKKFLLMQLNNCILDFKSNKIDYKQFRIKYNNIINLALSKSK